MNTFTEIEKYAIVNLLTSIMRADGIIHPNEEKYMNSVYKDFGITVKKLEDISDIDDTQTNHIIKNMSSENKTKAHLLCKGMAEADGFIHPKEMEIINKLFQ